MITNSSKTVPLADNACKEESALKTPPLSLVVGFFYFPVTVLSNPKGTHHYQTKTLRRKDVSLLRPKCSVEDFISTSPSKVSHDKIEPLLRVHIVLLPTNGKQARIP